ncbi:hypothetical protein HELRODRAFT_194078 [Helobdella robusta]|uniref:CTLH domain-containing protein n=1 Tax=Helobdella robusta TaxID=6412 RepID=T1FVN2_HELRO|nr:hypothetical protein HELRODRAFT_194078 [Helobdella robusta]ESN93380.1 hypothetical protein HELRODRAFT_194078 [Helobdella robusta]
MPTINVSFTEAQVIKMVLEFLAKRNMNIAMLSLERESGVINGNYSDDMLFLRQLVLDGQWEDAIEFIQPLTEMDSFDYKHFQYILFKHKYLELLCLKSESGNTQAYENMVDDIIKCVNQLESLCPTKDEFNSLCLLMSVSDFCSHQQFTNWNPSNARVECFNEVYPLVQHLLVKEVDKKKQTSNDECSTEDRLVQLLVKGLLYESCVTFCQKRATTNEDDEVDDDYDDYGQIKIPNLLSSGGCRDGDVSLVSWLQVSWYQLFDVFFKVVW